MKTHDCPPLFLVQPAARIALAVLLCVASACTKIQPNQTAATATAAARHPYTHAHELRFAVSNDIERLNPLSSESAYEEYLTSMCMAWLIKTDSAGNATVPELVTQVPSQANGGISKDGKTIIWHLRRGVKWSDGAPFDADDVVFSTQQVLNPANNVASLDGWDLITKIDEPDKYTVVYHLKKPYSSFAVTFFSTGGANPALLPQHLLRGLHDLNTAPYNALPVGIGPLKFAAWNRGDSVVMVRNPLYFRGASKLDRVVFKIIPDKNTTIEQLRTHELDLWLPISPHYYGQVQAIPGIIGSSVPSYTFDHVDFNLSHPMFADLAVRLALRYALDRSLLLHKVLNGLYLLNESPITPASSYDAHLPLVPHDFAKANALLDADGWKRGADGIRTKGGLRLSLVYVLTTGQPDYDTEAELIRGWWKQIGVEITIKRYSASQLFATVANGGILYSGKFDVARYGWGADPNEDLSNLYACYRFPPDGQNVPHWCDRAATAAMDRAKESYDRSARKRDLDFVQQKLYEQVPTVILYSRKQLAAYNDDLKGWRPNSVSPFDDILNVDI